MQTRVWRTCPCGWRSFCEAPGHTSAWDGEGSLALSLSCFFLCWDLFVLLWETSAPLLRTPNSSDQACSDYQHNLFRPIDYRCS